MTASQSDLSNAHYNYDIVVATTQSAINATIKEFLDVDSQPVANVAFVAASESEEYSQTNYDNLVSAVQKAVPSFTDPFSIPNGTDPVTNSAITALANQKFTAAVRLQLGLPEGYAPADIPDYVELPGKDGPVTFNLLCSTFQVVLYNPGNGYYGTPTWTNISQPTDGNAWIYSALVNLNLTHVPGSGYAKLPPAVQKQIKNLSGTAFSIQQLLFDLTHATLSSSTPTLTGVPDKFKSVLDDIMVTQYFKNSQKKGQPIAGVAVKQTPSQSTLKVTDLNFMVNPYMNKAGTPALHPTQVQKKVATLNYLCATNQDALPPASAFTWNWLSTSEVGQFDGIVAINRDTLARYFCREVIDYVKSNCFKSSVSVTADGLEPDFSWTLTRGQAPTTQVTSSGKDVLRISYSSTSSDQAGLGGDVGRMTLSPSYTLTATFDGDTIVFEQHLLVYLYARALQTSASGNIVDKTITDTYTLSVTDDGRLTTTASAPKTTDNSQDPSRSGFLNFFTGINDIVNDVKTWVDKFVPTDFTDIPASVAQSFVFPGGQTFAFKSVSFSQDQDLISEITYVAPGNG